MIEYELNENDHLSFQLYLASHTKRIVTQRVLTIVLAPALWLIFALLMRHRIGDSLLIITIAMSALWLILYPLRSHFQYRKFYRRHIRENYAKYLNRKTTLEIADGFLASRSDAGESKIRISEVEKVVETRDHYFVYISKGAALILKKITPGANDFILDLCRMTNLSVTDDIAWKWI
jgi:hypothetical protein